MSKITLKLKDLKTGTPSLREFDSEEQTIAYLKERPEFTDILGVVFEGLTPEQNAKLKAAMKPLNAAEKEAEAKLDEIAAKAAEVEAEKRAVEDQKVRAAHLESLKTADPNRTMEVRYRFDAPDLELTDKDDPRSISPEVQEAVKAWIAERNEWVEGRGQMIGEAKITVYPANLPKPTSDRILSGTFIPVTAAKK